MKCPHCHGATKVIDKRDTAPSLTRRRRECQSCHRRFTTYEKIVGVSSFIIKKDGRREQFNKEKLKSGILKACEKRPISIERIDKLVEDIETKLKDKRVKEVESKALGELVMRKLKSLDKVAYIRFASVYKNFEEIKDFKKVIKEVS